MKHRRRRDLAVGVLLMLLGAWFLVGQLVPQMQVWTSAESSWPLIVIGVGVSLLLFGLLVGAPPMAVPACIVAGIGGLLYWQNATGNWESWAYVWTLIPGFVGIGVLLSGLLEGNARRAVQSGGSLILTSLILFLIFGAFLGLGNPLGPYWPVLVIVLGLLLLVRVLFGRR